MLITEHPFHRTGRAGLPHPAPTYGDDAKSAERIGMTDGSQFTTGVTRSTNWQQFCLSRTRT
jgi:hypothetical protein